MTDEIVYEGKQICYGMQGHMGTMRFMGEVRKRFPWLHKQPTAEFQFTYHSESGLLDANCPQGYPGCDGFRRCSLTGHNTICGWDFLGRGITIQTASGEEANRIEIVVDSNGEPKMRPIFELRRPKG